MSDKPLDKRDYLNPDIVESLSQPAAIAWEVDPNNYWKNQGVTNERIITACGHLPGFIRNQTQQDCRSQLQSGYGMGTLADCTVDWSMDEAGIMQTLSTDEAGRYTALIPLMKLEFLFGSPQAETVRIYGHAFVSIRSQRRGTFITRMD